MVKDYVNIFPGPNFMSPKWRCLLKRGVPEDKFHCRPGGVLKEFLGGDVPLGPWNP